MKHGDLENGRADREAAYCVTTAVPRELEDGDDLVQR